MPSIMENIVDILANGKSTEISTLLKQALANLQKMSKMCHDAATSSNEAFTDLSGLAQVRAPKSSLRSSCNALLPGNSPRLHLHGLCHLPHKRSSQISTDIHL